MATGYTSYADITSLINNIYEDALMYLREYGSIVRTVTVYNDQAGMNPRKVTQWGAAQVITKGEGEDVLPVKLSKTLLATLTPSNKAALFDLTDEMLATNAPEDIQAVASEELASAILETVETDLAGNYSSLTGGTVGNAGSALVWEKLFNAAAILKAAKVPMPYFCVLHPYAANDLYNASLTAGNSSIAMSEVPEYRNEMVRNVFMEMPQLGGVTLVISPNTPLSGTTVTNAMYSPRALALDIRKPFELAPQRDESRQVLELNGRMWYAHGVWAAARGVQILSKGTTPS